MQSFKKYTLLSMVLFSVSGAMVWYQNSNASGNHPIEQAEAASEVSIWKSDIECPDCTRQDHIAKAIKAHEALLFQGGNPSSGPDNSPTHLVVFFDYQCIHCKSMASTLETLQRQNPTLKIIYKDLPILGSHSSCAAKAALAAHKQNKYGMVSNELLKANNLSNTQIANIAKNAGLNMSQFQSDMSSPAIAHDLDNNLSLAHDLTIKGTPVVIIKKNMPTSSTPTFFVMGNVSLEILQNLVHQAQGTS